MGDMAQECYVVAAENSASLVDADLRNEASSGRTLSIYSSRDLAARRERDGGATSHGYSSSREVYPDELRHILVCARDEGYTHVTLDGREMGIDGFRTLLDHERLE